MEPRYDSCRRIYDELQVRVVVGLETCMRKTQQTLLWMSQALDATGAGSDIMGLPPFCKLRAAVAKPGQQRDKCWIAGPEIVSCTELCDDPLGLLGPARSKQPARSRVEQYQMRMLK